MYKILVLFTLIQCISLPAASQTLLTGNWEGAFVRETSIQLASFTLRYENGNWNGIHDIPERGLFEEPLTDFELRNDTLFFRSRYGPFWVIAKEKPDQLLGQSVRWNPKIKLHLKRRPKPDSVYSSESFSVQNGDLQLHVTKLTPIPQVSKTAIVLVHGSGPVLKSDRYYRTEAIGLVREGYTVFYYDKRGSGSSTGSLEGSTLFDLASDAHAVLKSARYELDDDYKIGYLGISQGGWVSTIAAAEYNSGDFLILNVGPARTVWEQELDRVQFTMKDQGYDRDKMEMAVDHVRLMFELTEDKNLWNEYIESSKKIREAGLDEYVNTATEINDRHVSWWRANKYDPEEHLRSMKIPVLSLLGGADPLVPPATNYTLMNEYLDSAPTDDYTIKIFEGAFHNLQVFGTLQGNRWEWPTGFWSWQHKAEGYYSVIGRFLNDK